MNYARKCNIKLNNITDHFACMSIYFVYDVDNLALTEIINFLVQ